MLSNALVNVLSYFFLSYDHAHFNYHKRFSGKLILNLHELKNCELEMLHDLVH